MAFLVEWDVINGTIEHVRMALDLYRYLFPGGIFPMAIVKHLKLSKFARCNSPIVVGPIHWLFYRMIYKIYRMNYNIFITICLNKLYEYLFVFLLTLEPFLESNHFSGI